MRGVAGKSVRPHMYDGNYGVVAVVYRWFGQTAPEVLATQGWATAALLVVIVWKYFGFHMALLLAGRQGIGNDVLEAAKIDGATRWETTLNIILPLMRPVAVLSLFFSILGSLQAFAIIVALTDGGPSNSTHSAGILEAENRTYRKLVQQQSAA